MLGSTVLRFYRFHQHLGTVMNVQYVGLVSCMIDTYGGYYLNNNIKKVGTYFIYQLYKIVAFFCINY